MVAFDRSPVKLFTLRFSNKSVQAPSCERPKTSQWTLFLSFEINNCRRLMKKSGKLACHVVNSNIAPNIAGNHRVIWKDLWWKADSYRHLKHWGGCIIPLFQLSVWCEKRDGAWHCAVIGKQLLIPKTQRGFVLGLSQDRVCCTDSFKNFSVKCLKWNQSNDTHLCSRDPEGVTVVFKSPARQS